MVPPTHTHTHAQTHTHRAQKGGAVRTHSRVFINVRASGLSARVQHQQFVHVRVQPVAALEGGQHPRALPEGRVVCQRQTPPRQGGGGTHPGPAGVADAVRRPRDAVTMRPGPPPAAACPPGGLTRSSVPATSVGWLYLCPTVSFSLCGSLSLRSPVSELLEYRDRV